jgi:hypothetical protein
MNMKHRVLLTFPSRGKPIALACANGLSLRYEIRKVMTGGWQLIIEADHGSGWEVLRSRQFSSERAARFYARHDFRRRQSVNVAALAVQS